MDENILPKKVSVLEKLAIPISIVIAGILIAGALYFSNANPPKASTQLLNTESSSNMRPVSAEDHILGNPGADLVIVEYSDTECPFCKQFHTTMRRLMSEYGKDGKIAWVYRHFPIDSLHSKARNEAEATECANELGGNAKFWEYTNLLYDTTTSNNSLDPAELPKIAKAVGLDTKAFSTCLASGKYADKVEADYQNAVKSGGRGTPHSIIISKDGLQTVIQGAQPYDNLKQIIDVLLD